MRIYRAVNDMIMRSINFEAIPISKTYATYILT